MQKQHSETAANDYPRIIDEAWDDDVSSTRAISGKREGREV